MGITFTGKVGATGLTGFNQETGNASGLTVVADPAGLYGNVLRAYLNKDDALAGSSHRSEVNINPILAAVGSVAWYWFSVYVPADWIEGGNPTVLWQVHDTPDGGDPIRRPPLEFGVNGDMLEVMSTAAVSGANDNQVNRVVWEKPLAEFKGRWTDFVVNITWNYTSGGALKIWRDRRMVFVETGQKNCFNDVLGMYPKLGVYTPLGLSAEIPDHTSYHRGLVVGDGAYSTFDAFMAAASIATTELESVMFRGAAA